MHSLKVNSKHQARKPNYRENKSEVPCGEHRNLATWQRVISCYHRADARKKLVLSVFRPGGGWLAGILPTQSIENRPIWLQSLHARQFERPGLFVRAVDSATLCRKEQCQGVRPFECGEMVRAMVVRASWYWRTGVWVFLPRMVENWPCLLGGRSCTVTFNSCIADRLTSLESPLPRWRNCASI